MVLLKKDGDLQKSDAPPPIQNSFWRCSPQNQTICRKNEILILYWDINP